MRRSASPIAASSSILTYSSTHLPTYPPTVAPLPSLAFPAGSASPKSHIDANLRVPLSERARVREVLSHHQRRRSPGRLSGVWRTRRAHSFACRLLLQGIGLLPHRLRQERAPRQGERAEDHVQRLHLRHRRREAGVEG